MNIMGIDQSYTSTGIVILNEHSQLQHHSIISPSRTNTRHHQAHQIASELLTIADLYQPMIIALESVSFGSIGNVTRDLAGLLYVIYNEFTYHSNHHSAPLVVSPKTLKKFATGNGNANKLRMWEILDSEIQTVFQVYKKTKGRYDVTDAYHLAKYGIEQVGRI